MEHPLKAFNNDSPYLFSSSYVQANMAEVSYFVQYFYYILNNTTVCINLIGLVSITADNQLITFGQIWQKIGNVSDVLAHVLLRVNAEYECIV